MVWCFDDFSFHKCISKPLLLFLQLLLLGNLIGRHLIANCCLGLVKRWLFTWQWKQLKNKKAIKAKIIELKNSPVIGVLIGYTNELPHCYLSHARQPLALPCGVQLKKFNTQTSLKIAFAQKNEFVHSLRGYNHSHKEKY